MKALVPLNDLSRLSREAIEKDSQVIYEVLKSGQFFGGIYTSQFLDKFSTFTKLKNVIPTSSGTSSLRLILRFLKSRGFKKIATAANCGGYVTCAAIMNDLDLTFLDVDISTGLISLDSIKEIYSKDPFDVVVYTHLYGNNGNLESVLNFCNEQKIVLVEDCAQAFGLLIEGKHVGNFGEFAAFSFYPTKNLGGIGDSGAISCPEYAFEEICSLTNYGWTEKYINTFRYGENARIDEVQSAILLTRFEQVDSELNKRRLILDYYQSHLENNVIRFVNTKHGVIHLCVVQTDFRFKLQTFLTESQIQTAIHYPILDIDQPAWNKLFENRNLPKSRRFKDTILTVPCFSGMSDLEVEKVAYALKHFSYSLS